MTLPRKSAGARNLRFHKSRARTPLLLPAGFTSRAALACICLSFPAQAANITLATTNAAGTSGFNSGTGWPGGVAPTAGNSYFTGALVLRTPAPTTSGSNYIFGGDSLSIDAGARLLGKIGNNTAGNTTSATISVSNLILNGGVFDQAGSGGDTSYLTVTGGITVSANSFLGALGAGANNSPSFETLDLTSTISGSGALSIAGAINGGGDTGVVKLSAANPSYSGTITVATPGNGFVASATNRLLQLNNLNAVQGGTLNLTSVANGISFASAVNLGAFNIGGLSGTSSQTLTDTVGAAVALSVGGNNTSTEYSGSLSGSGTLTKLGSGKLTISSANSYTGTTSVIGGSLVTGPSGDVNGSSGITINGAGAKFVHNGFSPISAPVTVTSGTVDGTGTINTVTVADSLTNVVTNGNGTGSPLTIGALTFNDAATVNVDLSSGVAGIQTTTLNSGATGGGKITVNASSPSWFPGTYNLITYTGAIGGGGFSEFQKGTISGVTARQTATLTNFSGGVGLTINGANPVWTGALNANWTNAVFGAPKNWKLIGGGTTTDYINGDLVLFDDNTSRPDVVISTANVSPVSTTFANDSLDYTINSPGGFGISTGTVTLNGQMSVTLATPNTYPGGTTLNAGSLKINNASAIGTGPLTIAGFSTVIDNTSGSSITLTTNNAQNWNSDFTFAGSNNLNLGTGAVTLGDSRTVTTTGTAVLQVGGVIGGSGFGLTKLGTGTLVLAGANTYGGGTTVTNGTLVVTGAINSAAAANVGQISVADSTDNALLRISGGTINASKSAAPSVVVGSMGNGSIIVDSGTLNVASEFYLSTSPGAYGSLTLNAGTVNVGNWLGLSRQGGTGILNVRGGALNITTNHLTVGTLTGAGASMGVATFSGGTTSVTTGGMFAGEITPGIVNMQPGSTVNLLGALGFKIANTAATSYGIANLNGGTLATPLVSMGTGLSANLSLNGGTLKANASSTTFMQGLTEARVNAGGAIIDSGTANSITIAQPLLAASNTGVTAISLTANGTGYLDTPLVTVSGGTVASGGVGATAVANFDYATGQVTGITITNPGTYTDASGLTVAFSGGGGVAPVVGTVSTGANVSGGLNVLGTGAVTLTGVNTYTGATTVTSGGLALGGSGSINKTSSISVNGSGAKFTQASSAPLTVPVAVTNGTFDGAGAVGSVTLANNAANTLTNGNGGTTGMTVGNLSFSGAASLNLRPASTSAVVAATSLTTGASGTITVNASSPSWAGGTYNLISYTGAIGGGGFSRFALGTVTGLSSRQVGSAVLSNPTGIIALTVGESAVKWTGKVSGAWTTTSIASPKNWSYNAAETDFVTNDAALFDDTVGAGVTTVDITDANVSPIGATFANNTAAYTVVSPSGKAITGTGFVTKTGTGTVVMGNGGLNNYTGATTLNGGVFSVSTISNGGIASDLGASTNAAASLIFGGGTLRFTAAAAAATDRNFTITPGSSATFDITSAASGNLTLNGAIPATTGTLVKTGGGKLTLTGANLHTGGTTISGGTVESTVNGLNGGPVNIASGATLTFTGNNQVSTSTVTGGGAILDSTANTIIITGDHTGFTGSVTHTAAPNNTQFNTGLSTGQSAAYNITAGEFIFAGNGDYTLKMGSLASTAGNIRGGNSATGTTTLEVGNLGTSTSVAGNLNNGATKVVALTKVGAGTLTLEGTNTYSGATKVNNGTLKVNGTLSSVGGTVAVASGATLAGNGNIAGSVTIQTGGHQALAVAATSGAQVTRTIGGTLDLNGVDILDLTAAATPAIGTYTLATATGGIIGSPDTVTYTGIPGGSVSVVGNNLVLTVVSASGYGSWITGFGLAAADQDPSDDPDNDGLNNLMEYVLGGNPAVAGTSIRPTGSKVGTDYVFTFRRSDLSEADTTQTVEYGNDLTIWGTYAIGASPGIAPVAITENSPTADLDTVTVTIPTASATKFFARLKVVK